MPPACKDSLTNCKEQEGRCYSPYQSLRETLQFACPFTCKNREICGDIFDQPQAKVRFDAENFTFKNYFIESKS